MVSELWVLLMPWMVYCSVPRDAKGAMEEGLLFSRERMSPRSYLVLIFWNVLFQNQCIWASCSGESVLSLLLTRCIAGRYLLGIVSETETSCSHIITWSHLQGLCVETEAQSRSGMFNSVTKACQQGRTWDDLWTPPHSILTALRGTSVPLDFLDLPRAPKVQI